MGKQRAAPTENMPLKPAKELASMMTKLPKEERLRLEGFVLGLTEAHREDQTNQPPTNRPA